MSESVYMAPGSPSSIALVDPVRVITDTGELRWFAPGRLPVDVLTWFSRSGGRGAVEERSDTYRLDGQTNAGLKLRSNELLELKVRQSVDDEVTALSGSLRGRLEGWRRWSPANGLVELEPNDQWIDITKTIVKRRFLDSGVEVSVDPEFPREPFCDVELAALGRDGARWWSMALAAYGAPDVRRHLVHVAWDVVTAGGPFPEAYASVLGAPRGYPEWLTGSNASVAKNREMAVG